MLKKMITGGALAAFLTFGGLAGCGKADAALKDLEALKKKACECKDAKCAEAVEKDFEKFMEKHKDTKGSESQVEKAGKLAGEMMSCLAKAQAGGDEGGGEGGGEEK